MLLCGLQLCADEAVSGVGGVSRFNIVVLDGDPDG